MVTSKFVILNLILSTKNLDYEYLRSGYGTCRLPYNSVAKYTLYFTNVLSLLFVLFIVFYRFPSPPPPILSLIFFPCILKYSPDIIRFASDSNIYKCLDKYIYIHTATISAVNCLKNLIVLFYLNKIVVKNWVNQPK